MENKSLSASRRFYDRTLRALLYLSGFITCALLGIGAKMVQGKTGKEEKK